MKKHTEKVTNWGQALDWTWRIKWRRSKSARTVEINANHITNYCGKSFPLKRMGAAGFWMEMQSELQETGITDSTINRIISAGTACLRYTYQAGLHNVPCPKFDKLKEGEARLIWFTKEDVDKLCDTAEDIFDDTNLSDAIRFAAYTGVRQSELLQLRNTDIDWNHNKIWVGGIPDELDTKGKECRGIPLHPLVEPILQRRKDNRLLFGCDWETKDQLWYHFKKARRFAGFSDRYVWHSLRHSFGTFLGEVTHPRQIMALLGHKNIETSLRYVKATDEATRTAVLAI